ncbi:MAG: phenylalanine--tRNA ligase subunit beta [Chthonomonadales bacterium]
MLLPVEWLHEFVDAPSDPQDLAHRLTMAGLEVEGTEHSTLGAVLNIKVTPNRGDCLSVIGIAREVAAAYGLTLRVPDGAPSSEPGDAIRYATVTIQAPDLCPRYAARIIRNVRIGPSPQWMQRRLEAAGMRPVNNVVDVTNYVMLETGQPLHAFDYDRIAGHCIIVRRAKAAEKMRTLDGVERTLPEGSLVIADAYAPVAVAGVMGGAESEVNLRTQTVLLESAHFSPSSVRKTARALGLQTEASYRFERIVDPEGVAAASHRACELISQLGAGEPVEGILDVYPGRKPRRELELRPKRASLLLGYVVGADELAGVLAPLGFEARASADKRCVEVAVPSWRPDVVREVDLIEEVGRVLGYERIPERLPVGTTLQGGPSDMQRFMGEVRRVLTGVGLQEVVCHSLLPETALDASWDAGERVAIRNALSAELSGLRRSLLPGLAEVLARNARRSQGPLAFFEVGRVFSRHEAEYRERVHVGGILCGPLAARFWQRSIPPITADFYTARGIVEGLCAGLHCPRPGFLASSDPCLHPGRSARILLAGKTTGWVGEIHPDLAPRLRTRDRIVAFEMDAEALMEMAGERAGFKPLSPYPAVVRDLAPRVRMDLQFADLQEAIQKNAPSILERYELVDVFAGPPLPPGLQSFTLSFTFRAHDRTLTEHDVAAAMDQIRSALQDACGAVFPA